MFEEISQEEILRQKRVEAEIRNEPNKIKYGLKDREFAYRQEARTFPSNTYCQTCLNGGWCCKPFHHVGDCCLHCGLDERNRHR